MVLDGQRVFAQQIIVDQFFDGGANRFRAPFDDRFAPADDTVARGDLQKEPPRWYFEQFVIDDSHSFVTLPMTLLISVVAVGWFPYISVILNVHAVMVPAPN